MKKLLLLGSALVLAASCSKDDGNPSGTTPTPNPQCAVATDRIYLGSNALQVDTTRLDSFGTGTANKYYRLRFASAGTGTAGYDSSLTILFGTNPSATGSFKIINVCEFDTSRGRTAALDFAWASGTGYRHFLSLAGTPDSLAITRNGNILQLCLKAIPTSVSCSNTATDSTRISLNKAVTLP